MTADAIGKRIRDRRSTSGLSQLDLPDRLSVSQPLVSQWENGKAKPDPRQLEKLQEILGGITGEDEISDQTLPPIALWLSRGLSKRNMTANELSKKAGVSAPTVYNLLNGGAQNPQQRTLKALEVALEEKFERTKEEEESFRVKGRGIGELIDFNPHDPNDAPDKPGVYVFYDISGRPIYVGQGGIAERCGNRGKAM
jgi:transcriptional regulator with XRE-family HTH domain